MYGPPRVFRKVGHGVRIDGGLCTGCLCCIDACPIGTVLEQETIGDLTKARVANVKDCVGCQKCCRACPVNAVTPFAIPRE